MSSRQFFSPEQSFLLRLPPEIRKLIFAGVLALSREVRLYREPSSSDGSLYQDNLSIEEDSGKSIRAFISPARSHWLALLYTNRQLGIEASNILYGCNKFYLDEDITSELPLFNSFIHQIGYANASRLSHVAVDFPPLNTRHLTQTGELVISRDGLDVLEILGQSCVCLKTLEFNIRDRRTIEALASGIKHNPSSTRQLIFLIDRQLTSAIVTLKKIQINIDSRWSTNGVAGFLEECGWSQVVQQHLNLTNT